jgi:hypothetical protein
VGEAAADLTYDRGLMALYSPWTGGDLTVELVSGRGLNAASADRQFDSDDAKSGAVRFSQDVGSIRLGVFGYHGRERSGGVRNTITVFGPDATLPLGGIGELNLQFLRRKDGDPFFSACSASNPCPGSSIVPFSTTVDAGFAEATLWPQGPTGRLFFSALYNWIDADRPVVSLRLGEQARSPGYLSKYQTASAGVHYLYRRNMRMMGELGWDLEREQARFVFGTMVAF